MWYDDREMQFYYMIHLNLMRTAMEYFAIYTVMVIFITVSTENEIRDWQYLNLSKHLSTLH